MATRYNSSLGSITGKYNSVTKEYVVTSGVTITQGDMVYLASGKVTNATVAGARLIGQAQGTATGNAGGTVKVLVCVDPEDRYLMKNDNLGTTFDATHVGQYFDLIGATGAQLVDTSTASASNGSMLCLEYNPGVDPVRGDTTYGIFKIAEHPFTQTAS